MGYKESYEAYINLSRKELQGLCKKHNLPANKCQSELAKSLASYFKVFYRIPKIPFMPNKIVKKSNWADYFWGVGFWYFTNYQSGWFLVGVSNINLFLILKLNCNQRHKINV